MVESVLKCSSRDLFHVLYACSPFFCLKLVSKRDFLKGM
jgi:hypothetical protein